MAINYSEHDVELLATIRTDILARPDAYRDGVNYLLEQYRPERLHAEAMATWEWHKDDPTQLAAYQDIAKCMAAGISDPAEREACMGETLKRLAAQPSLDCWTPAACACQAIQGLLESGGEHHDAKAQAVVLLAVMLWDADADKRHSTSAILSMFGPWNDAITEIGRWAATYFLQNEVDPPEWMKTPEGTNSLPKKKKKKKKKTKKKKKKEEEEEEQTVLQKWMKTVRIAWKWTSPRLVGAPQWLVEACLERFGAHIA